ncbi:LexA family transcriptional regulator [uncultured Bacteroides sp.]|uniref:LexA family transcriptional regulator n=1 Tax=uncultured Bacteroides sp. TaxID=162156 RepID=UPI0025855C1C|nr:LexA family transcriptional regulator [uncultured Bacteroides sp.]
MVLQRIKEYIDFKGISISAFEKSIGMSNASFGRSLKNNGAIGTDKLENILNVYQEINPDWLLTGQGNMIRSHLKRIRSFPITEKKGIPFISYELLPEVLAEKKGAISQNTEYFSLPLFREADFLIPIKDNSMAPHYKGGDIIACKTLSCKSLFFQWNKVYLLLTPQGVLIKRVHPGEDEQHVMLVSDNTDYPPFQLDRSLISNVALVLGSLSVE